jgi:uncharacterized protein YdeI (YjbR/CyaY-like superfamily)
VDTKPKPRFFATAAEFRAWLEQHHADERELWVGFHKKGSGRPSITYPEAVAEALCFGWIDGVRRSVDDESYANRFTPRRRGSNWSAVNVKLVEELTRAGRMHPAGLKAFEERAPARTGVYSYENRHAARLDAEQEAQLRANAAAWEFFQAQPPGYRQTAVWWVVSAKRPETRQQRLATLIEDSANGRMIGPLARPPKTAS